MINGGSKKSLIHSAFFLFTRLDASEEDGSFARLLNDNHKNPNLFARVIKKDGEYLPAFFTNRTIRKGEELTYDYGGGNYWWREVCRILLYLLLL